MMRQVKDLNCNLCTEVDWVGQGQHSGCAISILLHPQKSLWLWGWPFWYIERKIMLLSHCRVMELPAEVHFILVITFIIVIFKVLPINPSFSAVTSSFSQFSWALNS